MAYDSYQHMLLSALGSPYDREENPRTQAVYNEATACIDDGGDSDWTEPRHATGRTPQERLIHALIQRESVEGMTPEDAAERWGLGADQQVIDYIRKLQSNQLLNPREG
jgi:hypothetical protein